MYEAHYINYSGMNFGFIFALARSRFEVFVV
jgi:hypothetical protein